MTDEKKKVNEATKPGETKHVSKAPAPEATKPGTVAKPAAPKK
jgi:hypothetical protein